MGVAGQEQDIIDIHGVVADAEKYQSDPAGLTQLLTEDVVLVNFGGRRVSGRDNVRVAMEQALATPFADVLTKNELADVRFLRPDVALVSAVKHISDQRNSAERAAGEPLRERGSLTFVLVKEQGRWLIALTQTTPVTV